MEINIGDIVQHNILGKGEVIDIYEGDYSNNHQTYIDIHFETDTKKYKVHTFRPDTLEAHLVSK